MLDELDVVPVLLAGVLGVVPVPLGGGLGVVFVLVGGGFGVVVELVDGIVVVVPLAVLNIYLRDTHSLRKIYSTHLGPPLGVMRLWMLNVGVVVSVL